MSNPTDAKGLVSTDTEAEALAALNRIRPKSEGLDAWLIKKGGYWYRPNCSGYTTEKASAGRYTEAKAKSEACVDPDIRAVLADDAPDGEFVLRSDALLALTSAEQDNAKLRARVEEMSRDLEQVTAISLGHFTTTTTRAQGSADDIRAEGWNVAVHNDYRLNGRGHTFWLFTKGDECVKGEGFSDAEALNQIRDAIRARSTLGGPNGE